MPKSQTERTAYTRQWREKNYKDKRFNKPLKEYIQLKYDCIFNEYCSFFKSLDQQHPGAKDLTKTRTFKKWKKEVLSNEPSESETEAGDQIDDQIETRTELNINEADSINDQIETRTDEPDILTATVREMLSPAEINKADNGTELSIDINQVNNVIQEIINDFEQDEALRGLLNDPNDLVHPHYEDDDEGIGLNVETELEDIVEPFDYNLEVEGFDFDF